MFIRSKSGGVATRRKEVQYQAGKLLPILSARELLGMSRHQVLLQQLEPLTGLSNEQFSILYINLIEQFAEFVQVLPSQPNGILSGLLNEGFARAMSTLESFLGQKLPGFRDPLEIYAIFSASLLFDIHKAILDHRVTLTNDKGKFKDYWYPLEGSMCGKADFYKLYSRGSIYQRLDRSLTLILARQLMPVLGYMWLSSDIKIFAQWLDALRGDASGGVISECVLAHTPHEIYEKLLASLGQLPVDMIESIATTEGDAFLAWLRDALEKGKLEFNTAEAGVHFTAEGLLIEGKVFKQSNQDLALSQFTEMFGTDADAGAQFISKYGTANAGIGSITSSSEGKYRTGVLLCDPAVVIPLGGIQTPVMTEMLRLIQLRSGGFHQVPIQRFEAGIGLQFKK